MFIGFNLRMQIGCWKWSILKSVSRSLLLPKLPSGWGSTCHRLVLTEPHSGVFLLIYPAAVLWLVAARLAIPRPIFERCSRNVWQFRFLFWEKLSDWIGFKTRFIRLFYSSKCLQYLCSWRRVSALSGHFMLSASNWLLEFNVLTVTFNSLKTEPGYNTMVN